MKQKLMLAFEEIPGQMYALILGIVMLTGVFIIML
jgi:hypothetical protein